MFHLLAYVESSAAGATDDDIAAVADQEFTRRNNHYIFTERYNALGFFAHGTSMTRGRLNVPTINAIGRHQIWPVERSATIPDEPGWQDMRNYPMPLPVNEEVAFEASNDLGAATEFEQLFAFIAPPDWSMNLPRGQQRLTVRATGALAGVANVWSTLGALTFAENLRGGWYSLVGATCFDAGSLAARFVFRRPDLNRGRRLRPGILCQEAIGNTPLRASMGGMGEFGRFHSFEPPDFEILANATAASVQEFRLDLIYLGDTPLT